MPRIVVLATGGTISSRSGPHGSVAADSADTLVGATSRPTDVVVESVDVLRLNSYNATLTDLASIARAIAMQLSRPEIDGVVVTHGTDTLEESAYLADLIHDDPRPVVFTGAQRGADHPYPDGPGNLADAVAVAACPAARDQGVLVSFAGIVHAADGIQKAQTIALDPFAGRSTGPVGTVVDGVASFHAKAVRDTPLPAPGESFGTRTVPAVLTYPGCGAEQFNACLTTDVQAVVVVGTGSGNPNAEIVRAIRAATDRGVIVALGTRVGNGPVIPIYGGGGGRDAVDAGAVALGDLPASQARILLALLLDHYPTDEAKARLIDRCGR